MTTYSIEPRGLFNGAPIISSYGRARAIADGVLVDLMACPETADSFLEMGVRYPVAMTRAAFADYFEAGGRWVPGKGGEKLALPCCQSMAGRAHDLAWMFRLAALGPGQGKSELLFRILVWDGRKHLTLTLKSVIGPGDGWEPVITLMLPTED